MNNHIASRTALQSPGNSVDRARIANKVEQLLAEREARYPALVEAGKLDEAEAARGLVLLRAIAAQWRWALDDGRPALPDTDALAPFGVSMIDLAAETRRIAERARALAGRTPNDAVAAETADLCEVIAWWQHLDGFGPRITRWIEIERLTAPAGATLAKAA